ncbi:MAG: sensor histidine kinase [Streptosporangiales bacterium]|nr:sensor histidine kinase [Streptosporangiales bacterium]
MLAAMWDWFRRHPRFVDGVLAGCFVLPNLPYVLGGAYPGLVSMPLRLAGLALVVGLCAPLTWRRRWPFATFSVMAALALVQWLAGITVLLADAALLVAVYTVAAQSRRTYTWVAFLVMVLGNGLAAYRWSHPPGPARVPTFVFLTVCTVAAMLLGDSMRSRRAYYAELEARADRLEREREQDARLAVAAERARIAREMHDVVAHNVSVMVVQAEGAAYLLDTDRSRSRAALETVATTGRQALAEMRRMLGVLRSDEPGGDGRAPQPGLADLPDLVARVRSAGLPVALTLPDRLPAVGAGRGLAAYRVVQEALTNVLKHAGPAASAEVVVSSGSAGMRLCVTDDGQGAAADQTDGAGQGLRGMYERVGVYGGTLQAGPRAGGGFAVTAEIPWEGHA